MFAKKFLGKNSLFGLINNQAGSLHTIPLLLLVTAVGIISYLLISSTAPFKGGMFSALNRLPFSLAATSYDQRVNAGGPNYTDPLGNQWAADRAYTNGSWGYVGGTAYSQNLAIQNTTTPTLYQTNRHEVNFRYNFDVPNGNYQVILKFAEIVPNDNAVGRRVFNVAIEGVNVLQNFDVFRDSGALATADDKTFTTNVTNGQLNIVFTGLVSHAEINSIEVISLNNPSPLPSSSPTFTPTPTATPAPTATPVPTATPAPTATPVPSASPPGGGTPIGYTTVGQTIDTGNSNDLTGNRITTTSALAITSMSGYVASVDSTPNNQYQFGIYTDSGGFPAALVSHSASGTLVANSWNTLPISANLTANTSYWLMYNTNGRSQGNNDLRKDSVGTNQGGWSNSNVSFNSWPATFPSPVRESSQWSLYASYNPDFNLVVTPAQQTMGLSSQTTFDADVTFNPGFTSNSITLSVSGLPSGVTGVFSPNPLPHEAKSTLFLTSDNTPAPGSYKLTISAVANGITKAQNATLVITSQPDYTLSVSPTTQGVTAGNSVSYNLSTNILNNFSSPINMSVSGLPSGANAIFSTNPMNPSTPITMTVTTTPSVSTGAYNLTITGTSGAISRTVNANLVVSGGRVWQVNTIGITGAQNNSAILGNGRNDGVNRLYVGTVNTGRIFEYTWNGSNWGNPVNIGGSPTSGEIHNMGLGQGRNDGVNRVYGCSLDGTLYELTFSSGSWVQTTVATPDAECTHAAVGAGRNDGINRLYATRGTGVYEYTWNGSNWNTVLIGRVGGGGRAHGIVLGHGRNGTLNGIYVASSAGGTYEGFYQNGAWTFNNMGDTGDIVNMYVGNGRNDGVLRVYAAVRNPGVVREFSWTGNSWTILNSPTLPEEAIHAEVLAGRNDGVNHIYVGGGNGNAYELTWTGSTWSSITLGGGTDYMYGLTSGNGRNDGVNRIYGASFDQHIYEYSY